MDSNLRPCRSIGFTVSLLYALRVLKLSEAAVAVLPHAGGPRPKGTKIIGLALICSGFPKLQGTFLGSP